MAKITLNLDKCVACGKCANTCPDIFEMDTNTFQSSIIGGKREGNVWTGNIDNAACVKKAAEGCVTQAINAGE